jgi:hypothetical protein
MDGWLSDDDDIVPMDVVLRHWGQAHVTDDTPCFCRPRHEEGLIIHRRMPWESSPGIRKERSLG